MAVKKQKTKMEEDSISKRICEEINRQGLLLKSLEVGTKKHVFIGTTVGMFKRKLRLLFQSAEQDIVIYYHDKGSNMRIVVNEFYERFRKSFPDRNFIVPIVIYEVKHKEVNTHQVRQYSEEARMIKTIFPFCQYNLLLLEFRNNSDDVNKVYMSSKGFDNVISFDSNDEKTIVESLTPGLKNHIKSLGKQQKFFKLNPILF